MRERLARAARAIGRRGAFLSFLALLDFLFGFSLVDPEAARSLSMANLLLPAQTWGWVWIGVGAFLLSGVSIVWDRPHFAVAAAWKAIWGFLYVGLWVQHVPRAWVSAAIWLSFAVIVLLVAGWPEPFRVPGERE